MPRKNNDENIFMFRMGLLIDAYTGHFLKKIPRGLFKSLTIEETESLLHYLLYVDEIKNAKKK